MTSPFKSPQTKSLIKYVRDEYGRDLEFLWPRFSENAIWRRGDNQKWFGAILTVPAYKIIPGAGDEKLEILDVRCNPAMIDFVVDKKYVFPGWHMNKRNWITIVLDGRMQTAAIRSFLDTSFILAAGK